MERKPVQVVQEDSWTPPGGGVGHVQAGEDHEVGPGHTRDLGVLLLELERRGLRLLPAEPESGQLEVDGWLTGNESSDQ